MPYETFSSDAFARLLRDELATYYAALGTRYQRVFFFEGQDPLGHALPAEAISALFWDLPKAARDRMAEGLIDVLTSRTELTPLAALEQIVTAIGLIHRADTLVPMVRAIGQRNNSTQEMRNTYASAIMVLKGFGPQRPALDAARILVGFSAFPSDLTYDALELLIRDPSVLWSETVLSLQSQMEKDYLPSAYSRIKARLRYTAKEIGARISINDIAEGLLDLIEPHTDEPQFPSLVPRRDPVGILVTELVKESNAPFEIFRSSGKQIILRSRNGNTRLVIRNRVLPRLLLPQLAEAEIRYSWMQAELT